MTPFTITTPRLLLRPVAMPDADRFAQICNDERVSRSTSSLPIPYARNDAEQWIDTHAEQWSSGKGTPLAICLKDSSEVIGSTDLRLDKPDEPQNCKAETGYLITVEQWGNGYATEACRALVAAAFDYLRIQRVFAYHFAFNPASGRVLRAAGMRYEGLLRKHHCLRGEWQDCPMYGVLATDPDRPSLARDRATVTPADPA